MVYVDENPTHNTPPIILNTSFTHKFFSKVLKLTDDI